MRQNGSWACCLSQGRPALRLILWVRICAQNVPSLPALWIYAPPWSVASVQASFPHPNSPRTREVIDLSTLAWFALLPVMGPESLQDRLREWTKAVAGEADFGHRGSFQGFQLGGSKRMWISLGIFRISLRVSGRCRPIWREGSGGVGFPKLLGWNCCWFRSLLCSRSKCLTRVVKLIVKLEWLGKQIASCWGFSDCVQGWCHPPCSSLVGWGWEDGGRAWHTC